MPTTLVRYQQRRNTATAWATGNEVLLAGEPGYETDTGKIKVGDGTTGWVALPYQPTAADVAGKGRAVTLNVKDFGATGDGVTADDAAFLAALTAAKNASHTLPGVTGQSDPVGRVTIEIPPGDYLLTTDGALLGAEAKTSKTVGLDFRGAGKNVSNIIFTPTAAASLVSNDYWLSVSFRDLAFYATTTGCTFFNAATTHNAQRFHFDNCEWNGWKYVAYLSGNNNNSEWAFHSCHSTKVNNDGAFLFIPATTATPAGSDQFLNFWFYGITHWSTDAPFIDAAAGGHFHIYGLDASGWGQTITTGTAQTVNPGKLFYLRGTVHARGVCTFEANGVRAEFRSANAGLIYSEWPAGNVTFRNADLTSQASVQTQTETVSIRYTNFSGPTYTFDQCNMAGPVRVRWSGNDHQYQHRIVFRDCEWSGAAYARPDQVVVYDPQNSLSTTTTPAVVFENCRGEAAVNATSATTGSAMWNATVGFTGGDMVQPIERREINLRGVYGSPSATSAGTMYATLPLGAYITDFEVLLPAGATTDTNTATWTLTTNETTPTPIAALSSPGAISAGVRVSTALALPFRCNTAARTVLKLVTTGPVSSGIPALILIKGYW